MAKWQSQTSSWIEEVLLYTLKETLLTSLRRSRASSCRDGEQMFASGFLQVCDGAQSNSRPTSLIPAPGALAVEKRHHVPVTPITDSKRALCPIGQHASLAPFQHYLRGRQRMGTRKSGSPWARAHWTTSFAVKLVPRSEAIPISTVFVQVPTLSEFIWVYGMNCDSECSFTVYQTFIVYQRK